MGSYFQQDSDFSLDFGAAIPPQITKRFKWIILIVGLILLFVLLSFLRGLYTDWLWFGHLGFRSVFIKVVFTRIVLFLVGALAFAVPAAVSLYLAHRMSQGPEELPLPQATRDVLRKLISWGSVAAVALLSVVFGVLAAGQWEIFLRFVNDVPFGVIDPVFERDVSFYVFSLPVYDFLQVWLLGEAIVVLLATVGLYFVNFSFRGVGFLITPAFKVHVSIIAALVMFILGLGHWLDRWGLLLSEQGAVFGAAYADLHARKAALLVLTIIAIASGVLILVNGYMRGVRLLVGGVALWGVMAIVLGILWPNTVQRLTVRPNEFAKEQPYIERNIEFTRSGFGLADILEQLYPVNATTTSKLISENRETVDNIRLWDHKPLASVYRQIQLIRPYYDFKDADVDRYVVDGDYRQVMLAAREVAQEKLDPDAQTWVNTRLRYTHGFGVAMSPVTEFTSQGRPEFFAKDIPADGVIAIGSKSGDDLDPTLIGNPRIYYGEKTTDYVIVNTNTEELDYQASGGELRGVNYEGAGGVAIGSFIRRAAYAWEFTDINILITGEITGESRIQYRREIQERISTVAPFLLLDQDPYIVAAEDGLFWVQDAYTVSDRYPYSEPDDAGFNYIRNSVKVTVDAFNGTLRFYIWDPGDPLVSTYQKIFPKLFTSKEEMPASLRDHVRYPQDLFLFQATKYLRYHMLEPQDFYNLEDIWGIPDEKFGQGGELQPVTPYYAIMKIPGEERAEFVLLLPYTRNEPPILAGWLAARSDGESYGELVSLFFPKDRQLDSPRQIEAKIDNDTDISPVLTLLCQEGSACIRGNLLVLPLVSADGNDFSLLYVEPVYLQAEGVEFPELKKVILASQDKVVMRDSVLEAIEALTGVTGAAAIAPPDGESPVTGATTVPKAGDAPVSGGADVPARTVQAGIDKLAEALADLQQGMTDLEKAIEDLKELAGGP